MPESVKGSNVFGSIEAIYPKEAKVEHLTEIVLYNIAGFMEEERDYMKSFEYVEEALKKIESFTQTWKIAPSLAKCRKKRRKEH